MCSNTFYFMPRSCLLGFYCVRVLPFLCRSPFFDPFAGSEQCTYHRIKYFKKILNNLFTTSDFHCQLFLKSNIKTLKTVLYILRSMQRTLLVHLCSGKFLCKYNVFVIIFHVLNKSKLGKY